MPARVAAPGRTIAVWPGTLRVAIPVRIDPGTEPACPPVRAAARTGGTAAPLAAELVRIGIEYRAGISDDERGALWMGRPGRWTLRPAADPHAPDVGAWVVAVDISTSPPPVDVLVGDETVPVRVVSDDARAGERLLRAAAAEAIPPGLGPSAAGRALATMLGPMLDSPLQRWRSEPLLRALLGDEAVTARLTDQPGTVRTRRPGEGSPDVLAAQVAARWSLALGTVARHDEGSARRLAARLISLVPEPGTSVGELLTPRWPTDDDGLAGLLDDLTDERLTPAAAAGRAESWLRSLGAAPRSAARPLPARPPVPCLPPGLSTGVFFTDWTMTTWQRAEKERQGTVGLPGTDMSWATGAFIARDSSTGAWCLWVESRIDREATRAPSADTVRVWFGAPERAAPAFTVTGDGALRIGTGDAVAVPIAGEPDRWLVRLVIPPAEIDAAGHITLAVSRTDPRGLRSSWPLACFPWDARPAAAEIDLSTWPAGPPPGTPAPGQPGSGSTIRP